VVFETLTDYGRRFAIAQRYIPTSWNRATRGVLLIEGEPVPYALARIPSAQDHRGNLAAGARGVGRPLNERDRWARRRDRAGAGRAGHAVRGLDVIGGFVTEINVTSPTGIRELDKQFGIRIGELRWRPSSGAWRARRARPGERGRDRRQLKRPWHAARSRCGRASPGLGPPAHHAVPGPPCCTDSSFSG